MTRPIEYGYNGTLNGVKPKGEGESLSIEIKIDLPFNQEQVGEEGRVDINALASWLGKRVGVTIAPIGLPLFPEGQDDAAEGTS